MDGIDVKNISNIRNNRRSYVDGARSAKTIINKSIKDGITFSAELIILSIILLVYSGAANMIIIGAITLAIVLLVASVITRSIFENRINAFYMDHPDKEIDSQTNKEYVNDSMSVLKMGSYTAIVNIITTTMSLITVCLVVLGIMTK